VEAEIQAFRTIDLAEILLNLQDVYGFDELTDRIKTSDVEPSLAELHVGRLLYINDVDFRFVVPSGKSDGDNYDLEITYPDGQVACGETKCKIKSTQLRVTTIDNALRKARGQLPVDRPGIIFMMVPQQWLETSGGQQMMVETANAFFRGDTKRPPTTRVVSVKYYVEPLAYANGILAQGHRFKEICNPYNKFDTARNWELLHYRPTGDGWDALPAKWIRLVNFPNELRHHGEDA
jgi:hypothetical protein